MSDAKLQKLELATCLVEACLQSIILASLAWGDIIFIMTFPLIWGEGGALQNIMPSAFWGQLVSYIYQSYDLQDAFSW